MAWKRNLLLVGLLIFSSPAFARAATVIYRSVGPGNTSALAAGGAGSNLTISGTTAAFTVALPNAIGVGDAIEYDNNTQVCFIHGRTDSRHYTVAAADGSAPATVSGDETWSIFRAYASLTDAQHGNENPGLDPGISDFDTGDRDMPGNNEQWNFACYSDATDTTPVVWDSWLTSATCYLRIFTPYAPTEVGVSQRHQGIWTSSGFRLSVANSSALSIVQSNVRIEGLQIRISSINADGQEALALHNGSGACDLRISDNIVRGAPSSTSTYNWHNGISLYGYGDGGTVRIWNNLVYDFFGVANNSAIDLDNPSITFYAYNNTMINCSTGLWGEQGSVTAINNLAQSCPLDFPGAFAAGSDYNLTDLAQPSSNAPGAHTKYATLVAFVDYAGRNCHLEVSDTGARDSGTNLSADVHLAFNNDMDLEVRSGTWDIGADECLATVTATPSPTASPVVSPSPTPTLTPSGTITPTLTASASRTPSATRTSTPTLSATRTISATSTQSATLTASPSVSTTGTITLTPTQSVTRTASPTPSVTLSATVSPTATPSSTISATHTISPTPTVSSTVSPTPSVSPTQGRMRLEPGQLVAYPNPVKGKRVWFYYACRAPAQVTIDILNVTGEKIATITDAPEAEGMNRSSWDAGRLAPGIYLYRARIEDPDGVRISGWQKFAVVR